jgi:hypothetical protein
MPQETAVCSIILCIYLDPEEMEKRAGEKEYVDAMRYVQGSLDRELENRTRK